jgi:hypothetical protein
MDEAELGAVIAAARGSMPVDSTHVVEVRLSTEGETAYVLLAAEVVGAGFYLDETICWRDEDGEWVGGDGAGGGFTDRTLTELRRDPPPPSLVEGRPMRRIDDPG